MRRGSFDVCDGLGLLGAASRYARRSHFLPCRPPLFFSHFLQQKSPKLGWECTRKEQSRLAHFLPILEEQSSSSDEASWEEITGSDLGASGELSSPSDGKSAQGGPTNSAYCAAQAS